MRISDHIRLIVLAFAAVALLAESARADRPELGLSFGYSHLSLDGNDALDGQGGARFEPRVSFEPFDDRPQVRFGFALGFSYFYDERDSGQIVSPPFVFDVDSYEDVFLLSPEFQVSWRQPLGDDWWIEGGVGVGVVFGFYSAGDVIFDDVVDENVDESDVGLGVRPFIRAAWHGDRWSWGAEAQYQYTTIDFGGPFGGDASEWYAGLFLAFTR